MNFYDKIHEMMKCLQETNEYKEYMKLKEEIKQNEELKQRIDDFKIKQRQEQMKYINGEQLSEESKKEMEHLYSLVIQYELGAKFFQAEIRLDVMLADMQKIINEGIKDIIEF